jgi:hypothetical protein
VRVINLKIEMGGACSTYGEGGGVHRVLVGKPGGERPLGRPRHRWIFGKWDVGVWTGLSWLSRDRWWALVNALMNLRVP